MSVSDPDKNAPAGAGVEKKLVSALSVRVKSALVGLPVVLFLLWRGEGDFAALAAVAAGVAIFEWARMVTTGRAASALLLRGCGVAGGVAVFIGGLVAAPVAAFFVLLACCFLVFCFCVYQGMRDAAARIVAGILYIGMAFVLLSWLRFGGGADGQGLYDVLVLFLIVWGSDTCAYFTGKTLGGPKLAPKISPGKTWSGFVGSSVGAGLAAGAMATPFVLARWPLVETIGGFGFVGYAVLGAVLAMAGQAGDLAISRMKRIYGLKDTGAIIPGHGGVLDRVDALLLVTILYALLRAVL